MAFLAGFAKRKALKYGTVFPGSNLSSFPKLFKIAADSDIAAELSGGGGIAVTLDDETTEIPFGLYPSSDPTSGDLILRVQLDPLTAASTGDVMGYLYYDSGATTTEDRAGVMDGHYVLFAPLEEDPSGGAPQIRDWVTDTLLGTSNGSMTSGELVAAQVANGLQFDGSDDFIDFPTLAAAVTDKVTIEVHLKGSSGSDFDTPVGAGSIVTYFQRDGSGGGANCVWTMYDSTNASHTRSLAGAFDNAWHALAGVADGSVMIPYVDGAAGASTGYSGTIGAFSDTLDSWRIGFMTGGNKFDGFLDEMRLSNVARSADWLAYAYQDDFHNADTFTLGTEETDGGGGGVVGTVFRSPVIRGPLKVFA